MLINKVTCLLCISFGCIMLIDMKIHHFIALHVYYALDIIAVRNAEIVVESALQRQVFFSVSKMPLSYNTIGVSFFSKHISKGDFICGHAGETFREEHTVNSHTLGHPAG